MHYDASETEHLSRLGSLPVGQLLLALLKRELKEAHDHLRDRSTPEDIYRAQGRARFLSELIGRLEARPGETHPRPTVVGRALT